MRRPVVDISPARRRSVYGHFTVFYAYKNGMPVLLSESKWHQINGFLIQGPKRRYSIVFRRRTQDFIQAVHSESTHCPTPETHNWHCGCPTDKYINKTKEAGK